MCSESSNLRELHTLISECMSSKARSRPCAQEVVTRLEALVPITAALHADGALKRNSTYAMSTHRGLQLLHSAWMTPSLG